VNGPHLEARTRPGPDVYFEARIKPESQLYRASQDIRNYDVLKNLACGYSCRFTALSHPK